MKLGNSKVFGDIQISLATSYLEMSEGNRKENLEKAIACQNMALDTCTEGTRPLDYAKLQYNMGYAYAELATRFGESFHDHAQRCFDNAVRTFRNLGQLVDARKAEEASRQIKRRFYDTVEQPNRITKLFAAVFWLFWRFCLFVPFFVQLHMMIKFGIISHISFLTRAFLFLPYYVFIEIGIRYIKRHEVVLSKHLLKSLGISGVLGAFIGAVFGYVMNNLIINYSGVSEQFLIIHSLMWAPLGIHILYVLKTLFLRSVNGSRCKWVKGSKLD